MLVNAKDYETELKILLDHHIYNPKYQWANGSWGSEFWSMPENSYENRVFASINDNNEVIGVIMYQFKISCMSVDGLCAMSFAEDGDKWIYAQDLRQCIDDMFRIYNFNRVEWHCYADNPAIHGYRSFMKRCGGTEIGPLHQNARLLDGKIHDSYIFEIMRDNYIKSQMWNYMEKRGVFNYG